MKTFLFCNLVLLLSACFSVDTYADPEDEKKNPQLSQEGELSSTEHPSNSSQKQMANDSTQISSSSSQGQGISFSITTPEPGKIDTITYQVESRPCGRKTLLARPLPEAQMEPEACSVLENYPMMTIPLSSSEEEVDTSATYKLTLAQLQEQKNLFSTNNTTSYRYQRVFRSGSMGGYHQITEITVETNTFVKRAYTEGSGEYSSSDSKWLWEESQADLGQNEQGFPLRSMHELFNECEKEVLSKLVKDSMQYELDFYDSGALKSCQVRLPDCLGDCDQGIRIDAFEMFTPEVILVENSEEPDSSMQSVILEEQIYTFPVDTTTIIKD